MRNVETVRAQTSARKIKNGIASVDVSTTNGLRARPTIRMRERKISPGTRRVNVTLVVHGTGRGSGQSGKVGRKKDGVNMKNSWRAERRKPPVAYAFRTVNRRLTAFCSPSDRMNAVTTNSSRSRRALLLPFRHFGWIILELVRVALLHVFLTFIDDHAQVAGE